jgi:membrane fusion protein (multidrug efflux system)
MADEPADADQPKDGVGGPGADEPIKDERSYSASRAAAGQGHDEGEKKEGDTQADEEGKDGKPKKKGLLQRPLLLLAGAAVLVIAIVGGLIFWLNARNYETTDDAFIDTHIVRVAPQISGRVTQVLVHDNQKVAPGDLMVTIDSADVETRVAQAGAQKAQAMAQADNARAQVVVNQAAYQQALAEAAADDAQAINAAENLARYRRLQSLNPAAVAQQQIDQAVAQARQTEAQKVSADKAANSRAAAVKASRTQIAAGEDQVRAAQSVLNQANLNFGYARIVSPTAGHVAQKTVAVGDYVEPGTQLMAVVPLDLWVTANFKETQLVRMRPGERVTVHVDACPGARIVGHVNSIQRGAGQAFAVLPPENATGNFVKVVQRVPVKIVLDQIPQGCILGPGMSVEPSVRVR